VVPPLRERQEDIQPLLEHFVKKYAHLNPTHPIKLNKKNMTPVLGYSWRGNIREFESHVCDALSMPRTAC
jgi:DNA-binding NtrC family response regulator